WSVGFSTAIVFFLYPIGVRALALTLTFGLSPSLFIHLTFGLSPSLLLRSARVDDFAADAAYPDSLAAVELLAADPRRLVHVRAQQHHVGHVNGLFDLRDSARIVAARLHVLLDDGDALDDELAVLGDHLDDLAGLAAILAGDDDDGVAFSNVGFCHGFPFLLGLSPSENLRRERDDLHELLRAQLAGDRSEDAGSERLALVVEDHRRVRVEADVRSVRPARLARRPHDDGLDDLTLGDLSAGRRFLDAADDHVADARIAAARASEHADAQQPASAGIV